MSRGQSQRRIDFRKRPLERCKSKGKASDIIDIDGDRNISFIIIDAPEPSEWSSLDASTSGKDKDPVYSDIICIDDDDDGDDDDSGDFGNTLDGFEGGNHDSHLTSSNKCEPSCNQGRKFFSKSSNFWDTCSRKISSLNHQKFATSTSFQNDDSDCYIEEDFLGNIRKQWEEAKLRKMYENVPEHQVNVDKAAEAQTHTSRNHEYDRFNPSACVGENAIGGASNLKSDRLSQHTDVEETVQQEMCKKSSFCNGEAVDKTTSKYCANSQSQIRLNPLSLVSNGAGLSDVQISIIGDREMLKKTDAYKRAQEEEWASRQRELQIQAEEARRLRKRRKAETQRLLETERRQKQRVDEVREAQKKDEETLTLKEQLRMEVRRDLDRLEASCKDMASLLRGLGIDIGGGLYPSSYEVRAAYKQALLRFHPDRASRSDIRRQIEAEEKFKLISLAKEKFML